MCMVRCMRLEVHDTMIQCMMSKDDDMMAQSIDGGTGKDLDDIQIKHQSSLTNDTYYETEIVGQ